MKRLLLLLAVLCGFVLSSCETLKQNIDARANLAKCQYELSGVELKQVNFGAGPSVDSLALDVLVKVTNKAGTDVAIDHVDGTVLLDKNEIVRLTHKKFSRIAPNVTLVEPVAVTLPFKGIINQIGKRPETIGVKARIWVVLLVGSATLETPIAFDVEINVPVPYDAIQSALDKEIRRQAASRITTPSLPSVPSAPISVPNKLPF